MALQNLSILLVDDEMQIRRLLSRFLKKLCGEVLSAKNGKEALELFERRPVDIVITDIRMPAMNGIELLKAIKASDPEQTVILFSGSNDYDFLIEAINLGADRFFNKPLDFDKLRSGLENIAKKLSAQKENAQYQKMMQRQWDMQLQNSKEQLHEFEQYQQLLMNSTCIRRFDTKGKVTYANTKLARKMRRKPEQMYGTPAYKDAARKQRPLSFEKVRSILKQSPRFQSIIAHSREGDSPLYLDSFIAPIKDQSGGIKEFLEIGYDVSRIYSLNRRMEKLNDEVIYLLGSVAESRSIETASHLHRVTGYCSILAKYTDMSKEEREIFKRAVPLHDIGKIAVPNRILQKRGPLDDEEFEQVKEHTTIGHNILCSVDNDIFTAAADIALSHHEKYDGSGYPLGLKGTEISFMGRLVAIADVFDALTSKRAYKKEWDIDQSLHIIKKERGSHFDPQIHDLFFDHIDEILEFKQQIREGKLCSFLHRRCN